MNIHQRKTQVSICFVFYCNIRLNTSTCTTVICYPAACNYLFRPSRSASSYSIAYRHNFLSLYLSLTIRVVPSQSNTNKQVWIVPTASLETCACPLTDSRSSLDDGSAIATTWRHRAQTTQDNRPALPTLTDLPQASPINGSRVFLGMT